MNEFIIKNGFFSQGSSTVTGSFNVTAGITGSLQGTASWASNSVTASYAVTASYVLSGGSGTSGTSGTSGSSGTSGEAGASGSSGTSGTSGESGSSGTSGTSGESGSSGTSGTSGESGSSGTSGTGFNTINNAGSDRILLSDGTSNAATASATITVSGLTTTISGSVLMSGSISNPIFIDYEERFTSPTISAGSLTLNLADGNVFDVALNANITTLTISSPPATNNAGSFVLIFTADGTPRSVTWGASVIWAGGVTPTLTSTNGKKDVFGFISLNSGTNWYGFTGGQNF